MPKHPCPKCGQDIRFPDTSVKIKVRCPACKHIFLYDGMVPPPLPRDQDSRSSSGNPLFARPGLLILFGGGIGIILILLVAILVTMLIGGGDQRIDDSTPSNLATIESTSEPIPSRNSDTEDDLQEDSADGESVPPSQVASPEPPPLSPEELFAKVSPTVVRVVMRDKEFKAVGQGSGFFVSSDGLVVTNHHVIEDGDFASVLLSNNATYFVNDVVAVDEEHDLALIKVNGDGISPVVLAEGKPPNVGAKVYAIGNPKGLINTFSEGIVSAVRADMGEVIQTTAPISPGSSGGPLIRSDGAVIGVTTFLRKGGQNLNFAVSVKFVRQLLAKRRDPKPLASAGEAPLDSEATDKMNEVWSAISKKNYGEAARLLTLLRNDMQGNASYWFAMGYVHDELGNYDLAINAYRKAIAIKPDDATAYYNMGVALAKLGRYTEALAAYKSAIAIKPDDANAYNGMGFALDELGRYTEALAAYKAAIAIKPDDADAYNNMGIALRQLGRYTEALAAYKAAIAIKPDDADAYNNMGVALGKLGRYTEALAAYKAAIAIKPDDADAYNNMGVALGKLGRYTEELAAYKSAIAIKPDHASAYYNMGIALGHLGRYTEAVAAYKSAIAIKPDDAKAYYGMGFALESLGRYTEAVAAYKSAVAIKPDYADASKAMRRVAGKIHHSAPMRGHR